MINVLFKICFSFFRLVLLLLHFTYSGVQYFDFARIYIKRRFQNFVQFKIFDSQNLISDFAKNLEKCPSHFVVIIGTDGLRIEDFSNLVIWCLAAKISFISFYDCTGYIKANKNIYLKHLIEKKKLDPKNLAFDFNRISPKNGILKKIHLNFLTLDDGKPVIVELTKNVNNKIALNEMKISYIHEELINQELFKLFGLPEPELAVIFGTICSSFGLLPWHVKVTEFLQIKHFKGIQVSDFISILSKYSSCNQRFGT